MVLLHIFDMDHTLIEADCDVTWKQFLVSEGLAPASALAEADRFLINTTAAVWIMMNSMRFSCGRSPDWVWRKWQITPVGTLKK